MELLLIPIFREMDIENGKQARIEEGRGEMQSNFESHFDTGGRRSGRAAAHGQLRPQLRGVRRALRRDHRAGPAAASIQLLHCECT